MNGDQKLNEFLSSIDRWLDVNNITKIEDNPKIKEIINLKSEDLKNLSSETCMEYAYELYAHSEYVERVKQRENTILQWADSSIWYIICNNMNQYGDKYTKWQEKYYSAIKENPLSSQILVIKNHAEARLSSIISYSENIKKMAEILNNMSKRKSQWT